MLAHAAEVKNADVVNFYFCTVDDAGVACHAKFASERFPGLATGPGEEGGHQLARNPGDQGGTLDREPSQDEAPVRCT